LISALLAAFLAFHGHSVTLKWNAVTSEAVYYNVVRCQVPCGASNPQSVVNSSPLICPEYYDNTVLAGVTYKYWVESWTPTQGDSHYSSGVEVTIP
jgi:hypothetical protein